MREPPGATAEDYQHHLDRLVEHHGPEWVIANQRMIDRRWDTYRMLCWLRARPEDFGLTPAEIDAGRESVGRTR
jgi:hypothetical protein